MSHRQPYWTTTAAQQEYAAQQRFATIHAQQYATQHLQVTTQQHCATQHQQVATQRQQIATKQQKVTKQQQKAGTRQLEAENQEQHENTGTTKTIQQRLK